MYKVYGTEGCKWCDRAVELLDALGKDCQYVDVSDDPEAQQMFRDMGIRSVPQVFLGSQHIGGFEALKRTL